MSDEAALLAAILAHPDEDTPRLMFADWLDENGHSARAEFIRVQIAITRLPDAERQTMHYRAQLIRFRQLVAEHAGTWAEALGVPSTRAIFRRGFVEEVAFTTAEVPTADNPALLREPLRVVRVVRASRERGAYESGEPVLRRLASWPGPGRVHTLRLNDLQLHPTVVEQFLCEPVFADLRALDIGSCTFPPGTVAALAACPNLAKLEHLELGVVRLSAEQAFAFARTPNLKNLRCVEMSVRYDRADDEDAPDPMQPAIDALQARYGRKVWASRW